MNAHDTLAQFNNKIKSYEDLVAEFSGHSQGMQDELRAKMDSRFQDFEVRLEQACHSANQTKTMIRNTTHHYTQLHTLVTKHEKAVTEVQSTLHDYSQVRTKAHAGFLYLNKYQPLAIFKQIVEAVEKATERQPAQQRIDFLEYAGEKSKIIYQALDVVYEGRDGALEGFLHTDQDLIEPIGVRKRIAELEREVLAEQAFA